MTVATGLDQHAIEQFLYREARLADEHDYDGWEALWTDDAEYWVPVDDTADPREHVSVIFDNRSRIATRLNQLRTGRRYAQSPPSNVRRLVGNVEIVGEVAGDLLVGANFVAVESKPRGNQVWAGRCTYRLRLVGGEIRLVSKKVNLVDADRPIPTLAFLV